MERLCCRQQDECVVATEAPELGEAYIKENYITRGDLTTNIIDQRQYFPTSLLNAVNGILDNLMNQA